MKTKYLLQLFITITLLFNGAIIHAQTIDSNHVDGTVYLKIYDTSTTVIDPYLYNIPALNQIIVNYDITEIVKAFKTPDAALQKVHRIQFNNWTDINALLTDLQALPFVEYAEKAPLYHVNNIPNDYSALSQWGLARIEAHFAWDISTGNPNVTVAVLDNAIAFNHEDLLPNTWTNPGEIPGNLIDDDLNGYVDDVNGYDVADGDNNPSPPSGITNNSPFIHGTHCSGIASAATNNTTGIASIGYSVNIIPVKCTSDNGSGEALTHAYEGLDYALSVNADIVSMSFGSSGSFLTWNLLINVAETQNVMLIAAAGNANTDQVFYPAGYPYVFAVGATNQTDQKASFSNYGNWIDVMAPGVNILSTLPEGNSTYGILNGTSMACPFVAGLAGLLKSVDGAATVAQMKDMIKNGCDNIDIENPGYSGQLGAGRINAYKTLQLQNVVNTNEITSPTDEPLIYPNPSNGQFYVRIPGKAKQKQLIVFNSFQQIVHTQSLNRSTTQNDHLINLKGLPTGQYYLRIETNQSRITKKLNIYYP